MPPSHPTSSLFALSREVLLEQLGTSEKGLTQEQAAKRLASDGPNTVRDEQGPAWFRRARDVVTNPLVELLAVLGTITFATGDMRAALMIAGMLLLGVVLRYIQEDRSLAAAKKLS